MINSIIHLIKKDALLEWRQRYALNGMLLFAGSAVFITYLSLGVRGSLLSPFTWNSLFWIIMLFTAVNAISKSFIQEKQSRFLYYYNLTSPQALILSKIIYNFFLMIVLSAMVYTFYILVLGNPVDDPLLFIANIILGALAFSGTLTLISGIASKAEGSNMLMSVLSFPVIIPVLILLIKVSKNAIDGLDRSVSFDDLIILSAINVMVICVSYILFPFIWRS